MSLKAYDPSLPLFFHHIPKAAGNSIRELFRAWFGSGLHLHYMDNMNKKLPARLSPRPGECVYGHFNAVRGFGMPQYYPDAKQCMTFMREPFARTLSQWRFTQMRHAIRGDAPSKATTFWQWMERRVADGANGKDGKSFVCQFPKILTSDNIDQVLKEYFVFVGITERMAESVAAAARVLGRDPLSVPRLNVTEGLDSPEYRGAEYRSFHEKHFPVEHEAYAIGLKLNAQVLAGMVEAASTKI